VKFADAELIGVPRVLVSGRGAADGQVEVWDRRTGDRETLPAADAIARLTT
jgi:prolyl-tRNA synthetase